MNTNVAERIKNILSSPSLTVLPVGDAKRADRGILHAAAWDGRLATAVKAAFSALVVAAALAATPQAQASGVGYDADVYSQGQGQVMQQGAATRMTVVNVRPVMIDAAPQARSTSSKVGHYAVTAAGTGVGGIVGAQLGGKTNAGRQVGSILGALVGGTVANVLDEKIRGEETRQVEGTELTMVNPATQQLAVITQAGTHRFAEGDSVLVIKSGNSARVVPDRSQTREVSAGHEGPATSVNAAEYQGNPMPLLQGTELRETTASVVRSAAMMGVRVDAQKVAQLLETGVGERNGLFVGKIVGVDMERGVVYQSTGIGKGVVHSANALSRVPAIGEMAAISMREGRGMVAAPAQQNVAMKGLGR